MLVILQFRFTDKFDVCLILLGTLGAICQGATLPVQFLVFGGLSDAFIDYARCPHPFTHCTKLDIEAELTQFSYYYIAIAVGLAVATTFQMVSWGVTAERQVHRIRKEYFKSILRQDMVWFDTSDGGELNTRLSEYVLLIKFITVKVRIRVNGYIIDSSNHKAECSMPISRAK